MQRVERTEEVPYTPGEMFALVADIERYPEFLPGCKGSRVVRDFDDGVEGELKVGYGPFSATFTTRAWYRPDEAIELRLVKGLFASFEGAWRFEPLPSGGTRVSFRFQFEFGEGAAAGALKIVFGRLVENLRTAFENRARDLYGPRSAPATRVVQGKGRGGRDPGTSEDDP